jgi:hypothetical protein
MRRAVALGAIVFIAGCGEGPKHLPKADYQHGKAAFELLEQEENTSSAAFGKAASSEIFSINRSRNSGLRQALLDYDAALLQRQLAKGQLTLLKIEELNHPERFSQDERLALESKAESALGETAPLIKLCRDDVAQYFDASAASSNSCNSELKAYRATHK